MIRQSRRIFVTSVRAASVDCSEQLWQPLDGMTAIHTTHELDQPDIASQEQFYPNQIMIHQPRRIFVTEVRAASVECSGQLWQSLDGLSNTF